MAITTFSAVGDLVALDFYTGNNRSSKDIDLGAPDGPTLRVEIGSTIGDCSFGTFVPDLLKTKALVGKEQLLDAYHLIISQTHEEADPYDEAAGQRQHDMVREMIRRAFPGHQAKLTTQRDNGRWAHHGEKQGLVWVPGKWHTHVIISNVSEQDAVLERIGPDGAVEQRFYAAGRAIDGYMNGIKHLRNVTDVVVWEHLGYDNEAYIQACRDVRDAIPDVTPVAQHGETVTSEDLAQRAQRGHSSHDEVRVDLRESRALATSWDDYVARLGAAGVHVRVTGKGGVSYGWVGDDGVQMKGRARGKEGLGNDFTKAEVEKQCELNAQRLADGDELVSPPRVLVPPPPSEEQKAKPHFPAGQAPWEKELAAYAAAVEADGGTYESQARAEIDAVMAETDALGVDEITDELESLEAATQLLLGPDGSIDVVLMIDGEELVMPAAQLGPDYANRAALEQLLDTITTGATVPAGLTQGTQITSGSENDDKFVAGEASSTRGGRASTVPAGVADVPAVDAGAFDRRRAQDTSRRAAQLAAQHRERLKQRERADDRGESADRNRGKPEPSALQRGLETGVRASEPDPTSDPDDDR